MSNKSYYFPAPRAFRTNPLTIKIFLLILVVTPAGAPPAMPRDEAPAWVHALVDITLPAHDEKTDAVLMYSSRTVTVLSADRTKTLVREAYKILRPGGRDYGVLAVYFNPHRKITSLHGWCIPVQGKDYEVRDRDAVEVSIPKIEGSELISDVKDKLLSIPAPDPGNLVGYEYEIEEQPLVLEDAWNFQEKVPVREGVYSLQMPSGWEYKAVWMNHPEVKPTEAGSGRWQWTVRDVKELREEEDMPPWQGVAGRMIVSFLPPGGSPASGFTNWQGMGVWYHNLTSPQGVASAEIKDKVKVLTASAPTLAEKMRALAQFIQHDIRYVAIELGIGGWQPHPAAEIFTHHYGDCKDKTTLLHSMLHEIGVDSYYVAINTTRGSVTLDTPAHLAFNHVIIAIKLPEGITDPAWVATMRHPKLGNLLFFDPTSELAPLGEIGGLLQANYGLLVTPEGGELVRLPQQTSAMNSIQRKGTLTLDAKGTLRGDIEEVRLGDRAASQRWLLRSARSEADKVKPVEKLLADSLSIFHISKAEVVNLDQTGKLFAYKYSFEAERYAKIAGNMLLVRPRVVGSESSTLLETKEARKFPVEFDAPVQDTDTFEIAIPPGFVVDDFPSPVEAGCSFASYRSKTVVEGNLIRYSRTFEVKELSVPVSKVEELKKFYRTINTDERNTVVLKPAAK